MVSAILVGLGRVHSHYYSLINQGLIKGLDVVGLVDLDSKLVQKYSSKYHCPGFGSIAEAIDSLSPDLVVILTPSSLHYSQALLSLEQGCNVLVEKPLAMRVGQAEDLHRLASSKNLFLGVAFQNRFNPAILALKSCMDNDMLGTIVSASVRLRWCREQSYYEDDWHGRWISDGGVINQQAIHHIDAMQWILGPVDSVCATYTNRVNKLEAEDTLVGIVRFVNGALATIETTTAARPQDMEASLSVVGSTGYFSVGGIALNHVTGCSFVDRSVNTASLIDDNSVDVPTGYGLSHVQLLNAAVNTIANGTKFIVDTASTIATTKLIHSLYASAETSQWVALCDNLESSLLGL